MKYILKVCSGEYEDYIEKSICVFDNKTDASLALDHIIRVYGEIYERLSKTSVKKYPKVTQWINRECYIQDSLNKFLHYKKVGIEYLVLPIDFNIEAVNECSESPIIKLLAKEVG